MRLKAISSVVLGTARLRKIGGKCGFWVEQRFSAALRRFLIVRFSARGTYSDFFHGHESGINGIVRNMVQNGVGVN